MNAHTKISFSQVFKKVCINVTFIKPYAWGMPPIQIVILIYTFYNINKLIRYPTTKEKEIMSSSHNLI